MKEAVAVYLKTEVIRPRRLSGQEEDDRERRVRPKDAEIRCRICIRVGGGVRSRHLGDPGRDGGGRRSRDRDRKRASDREPSAPDESEYLGIPYAKPPVGTLRWRPPKTFGRWKGVFEATAFGNVCPQMNTTGAVVGDENCLFLNVYTPHGTKTVKPHGAQ